MQKEICWNITARCNQACKYCHRFLEIKELSFEEQKEILERIIEQGIKEITWTGGEALIVKDVDKLMKLAFDNKVKNKLITNGIALTNEKIEQIIPYLDSLTLSIDSIDPEINEILGRGKNHYNTINRILTYIKEKDYKIKVRVNSVVTKINLDEVESLSSYLNNFEIFSWRIFKFLPLRETSVRNKELFDISVDQYEKSVTLAKSISKVQNIESRIQTDMEDKYILILADGSIVVTRNAKDVTIGNALKENLPLENKTSI